MFSGFDGYKEDLMEFGVMGLAGTASFVAWGMIAPKIPNFNQPLVENYGKPALALLAAAATAQALSGVDRRIAVGAGVGLALAGVLGFAKAFGVPGFSGATAISGFGGAPIAIEEVSGFGGFGGAPVTVEEVSGVGSFIG